MLSFKRNQPGLVNGGQGSGPGGSAPGGNGAGLNGRGRYGAEAVTDNTTYILLRDRVQQRLLAELNPTVSTGNSQEVRRVLERIFAEAMTELNLPVSRAEQAELLEQIASDIMGFGPLDTLLHDDSITEVLVNGTEQVFVERGGVLYETDLRFKDPADVMRIIERIVTPLGRRVDESSPMVDARLPDGSRVNVIIPPLSLIGPCISIRKFGKKVLTASELIRAGAMTQEMAEFLRMCVRAALNVVVSGGTSTGKTTYLNMLSSFIPEKDRIITIEDAAELKLQQRHVIRLEARPANVEGQGHVSIRQLVINALRMRPDRIVVGEVRGGEALDMLQAMNTGHDGSLTTVHSNSARDTLARVETMVLMAGMDLPLRAIREQIAAAFDLVVHLERLADGSRRVVQVTEVQGMEGDIIVMQDIFRYVQTGYENGKIQGHFTPTGVRPKFMEKLESRGLRVPVDLFMPAGGPSSVLRR
ncbi:MAG: CpaF family protein [Caldilineaceae bacterium]